MTGMSKWDVHVESEAEFHAIAHLRGWTHLFSECPLCRADSLTNGEGMATVWGDAEGGNLSADHVYINCTRLGCLWISSPQEGETSLLHLLVELRKHLMSTHAKARTHAMPGVW